MSAKLLLGKTLANDILHQLKGQVTKLRQKPCLAVILVGQNPSSKIYVRIKERTCERLGIKFRKYLLPADVSIKKIVALIQSINHHKNINGLIVQLPLPQKFNTAKIMPLVARDKDIDGFTPGSPFVSPVYQGIFSLLKKYKINLKNKTAVILANSLLFGQPLEKLLRRKMVKPETLIIESPHLSSATKNKIKKADLVITALGRPRLIKPNMIKRDCAVIDVGFSRLKNKLYGDVDPSCRAKAAYLSPVPGGVGPLTVAFLLKNLINKR